MRETRPDAHTDTHMNTPLSRSRSAQMRMSRHEQQPSCTTDTTDNLRATT